MPISKFLDPKNDVAFRKIFGSEQNKDILIAFLNDILKFRGKKRIEYVEFLSPVQDPFIAMKKESIVDVLCKDHDGTQYIIEMQVNPSEGFEKRVQYYAAKAYYMQTNRGKEEDGLYKNLKEIIFIAVSDTILFSDKERYLLHHVILDKESYEHNLKDFSFTFIELPKFKKDKIEDLTHNIEKWCYFFKHAKETTKEVYETIAKTKSIKRAYEALIEFNWTEDELFAYEKEQKRI